MKNILIAIIVFPALLYSQWAPANSELPEWLSQGWAIDALNGSFAVISVVPSSPDEWLYKTEDGGTNWIPIDLPQGRSFSDVSIVDENRIFGCSMDPREILGTYDGGLTWEILYDASQESSLLNYIEMFDENNGIVMGDAIDENSPTVLIKTTDGGHTWSSINTTLLGGVSGNIWTRIDFITPDIGYFFDSETQKLLKTVNGGSDWTVLEGFPPLTPNVIKFYDENTGIAAHTFFNMVFRTFDGGVTWDTVFVDAGGVIGLDFEFMPGEPSKVWFATLTELFFSNDGGTTWQTDPISNTFEYGRDIEIADGVAWFLCETVYRNENPDRITSVENESEIFPEEINLSQNYPNPFNPSTTIKFQIPRNELATLKVYDILGREVATLVDEEKLAGYYEISFNSKELSSGIYYYRLKAGDFISTKKMILLK